MTQPSFQNTQPKIHPERQRRVRNALTFFSVSAWVTGVFLIALCVVMVLKYLTSADVPDAAKYVAIFHGWVYILSLIHI